MMFWLWALLALATMFAVLLVAPEQHLTQDWSFLYELSTQVWMPWLLSLANVLVVALLFACLRFWQTWQRLRGRQIKSQAALVSVTAMLVLVSLGLFALRAFLVHNAYDARRLTTPIKVVARVQVYELSDGIYDAALGTRYRQKAVIDNLQPVIDHQKNLHHNPYYSPAQDEQLAKITEDVLTELPQQLTVLLSTPTRPRVDDDFSALNHLHAGQYMYMTLSLSAINPKATADFDNYRWLLSRHIHAQARILAIDADSLAPIEHTSLRTTIMIKLQQLRQSYRDLFYGDWHAKTRDTQQGLAVTLSLLTGDRALIDGETRALYQLGGISHLLAISGAHVLFFAWLLSALGVLMVNRYLPRCYYYVARPMFKLVVMLIAALTYALFVGFDVPAVRTVYMLVALGLARYLMLTWSPLKVLCTVALVMVWLDPYVLWQAAFWLSFVAVILLMTVDDAHTQLGAKPSDGVRQTLLMMLKLQTYVFVAMLPISILLFGKVSLFGLLVNLFAVALFGWVIVPLNLTAGALYALFPSLAVMIWTLLSACLSALARFFEVLSLYSAQAYLTLPMNAAMVLLAMLSLLLMNGWLLLPVLVLGMAISSGIHGRNNTATEVILSPLVATPEDSWLLVRYGAQSWLILSAQPNQRSIHRDDARMADSALRQLRQQGVFNLSGIVVQNPDEVLNKMAGRIGLAMPVELLWVAGKPARYGRLQAQVCHAGKRWQSTDGRLNMHVMTGWPNIPDTLMHGCTLWLQADVASQWQAAGLDAAVGHQIWQNTSVVVDGARDDGLWQLWQLMCHNEHTQSVLPTQVQAIISHSRSPMAPEWAARLGGTPILSDVSGDATVQLYRQRRLQALINAQAKQQ